jgi:hypothetical protein
MDSAKLKYTLFSFVCSSDEDCHSSEQRRQIQQNKITCTACPCMPIRSIASHRTMLLLTSLGDWIPNTKRFNRLLASVEGHVNSTEVLHITWQQTSLDAAFVKCCRRLTSNVLIDFKRDSSQTVNSPSLILQNIPEARMEIPDFVLR